MQVKPKIKKGYVDEVGSDVHGFKENDKVLVIHKLGCCSKYIKSSPGFVNSP